MNPFLQDQLAREKENGGIPIAMILTYPQRSHHFDSIQLKKTTELVPGYMTKTQVILSSYYPLR